MTRSNWQAYLFLGIFMFGSFSQATSPLRGKQFRPNPLASEREEVVVRQKPDIENDSLISNEDMQAIVPMDMQTTNDGNHVRNQIISRSASRLMESPIIKNSFLFRTAKSVEETTKVDMEVKGSRGTAGVKQEVSHKFNFDIQAFKQEARFLYNGYVDSKIQYQAVTNTFQFSLEESLSPTSKIALTHSNDNIESKQILQYNITW